MTGSKLAPTPTLPARTPAEVADWAASPHPEPRSGFLEMSTNLGLGDFGTTSGDSGGSLVGLAAGSNDARLWQDGSRRRIALLQQLEETDWYRNGDVTYVWHSRNSRVTKVQNPAPGPDATGLISALAGGGTIESPDGMAARFLPLRTQATRLALREPTYVADRPVYQLALIPDTPTSLVTEIVIGVDAATGVPLKVAVHTRSGTVAIESKFTSIDFKRPAASNLAFQAPPEAKVADGANVIATPNFSNDERQQRDRARTVQDVQSVKGVDQTLLRLATVGGRLGRGRRAAGPQRMAIGESRAHRQAGQWPVRHGEASGDTRLQLAHPGQRPHGGGRCDAERARVRRHADRIDDMSDDLAIETTGLTKRLGHTAVVDQVDLAVPRGSVYGFLGPNGSGKTTTIRMLLGLIWPTAGSFRLLGKTMPAAAPRCSRRSGRSSRDRRSIRGSRAGRTCGVSTPPGPTASAERAPRASMPP